VHAEGRQRHLGSAPARQGAYYYSTKFAFRTTTPYAVAQRDHVEASLSAQIFTVVLFFISALALFA
jgi:hypothetical protein